VVLTHRIVRADCKDHRVRAVRSSAHWHGDHVLPIGLRSSAMSGHDRPTHRPNNTPPRPLDEPGACRATQDWLTMTPAGARLSVSCCFHTRKLRAKAPPACAYQGGRFLICCPVHFAPPAGVNSGWRHAYLPTSSPRAHGARCRSRSSVQALARPSSTMSTSGAAFAAAPIV
jgi:hypothetical protein